MKLFFTIALLFLSLGSFAQNQQPADQIMGQWRTKNPLYGQGVTLYTEFLFLPENMTVTGRCFFRDQAELSVSLNVKVRFDGNDLWILEQKQAQVEDGLRYCRVYLTHDRWNFYFTGTGEAVLVAPVPYGTQFQLKRIELPDNIKN